MCGGSFSAPDVVVIYGDGLLKANRAYPFAIYGRMRREMAGWRIIPAF